MSDVVENKVPVNEVIGSGIPAAGFAPGEIVPDVSEGTKTRLHQRAMVQLEDGTTAQEALRFAKNRRTFIQGKEIRIGSVPLAHRNRLAKKLPNRSQR